MSNRINYKFFIGYMVGANHGKQEIGGIVKKLKWFCPNE